MRILWMLLLASVASAAMANELLWEKLANEPHMVVLMRNSESTGNRDGTSMLVWDESGRCRGESTLTDEGRAQARRIGAAFDKHGIRARVISSPMCRCTETAAIAFGKYLTDPDLRQRPLESIDGEEVFQAKARSMLSRHRGKSPVVFVNHRPNIDSLTMELIDIGDLLIGSITEDGEIELVGKIKLER